MFFFKNKKEKELDKIINTLENLKNAFSILDDRISVLEDEEPENPSIKLLNSLIDTNFLLKKDFSSYLEKDNITKTILFQIDNTKNKCSEINQEILKTNKKIENNLYYLKDLITKNEDILKISIDNVFSEINKKQTKHKRTNIAKKIDEKINLFKNKNNQELLILFEKFATNKNKENDKQISSLKDIIKKLTKRLNDLESRYNKSISPNINAGKIVHDKNSEFNKLFDKLSSGKNTEL